MPNNFYFRLLDVGCFFLSFFFKIEYILFETDKTKSFLTYCTWIRVFIVFDFIFEDSDDNSWYPLSFSLYTEVRGEKWGSLPLSWSRVISGYLEPTVCQSTGHCLASLLFQSHHISDIFFLFCHFTSFFYHKWGQRIEQVSTKKCVCQGRPAVNCSHSHHNTFELSGGCFLLIDHSVESSFLICVVPLIPAASFSSPLLC